MGVSVVIPTKNRAAYVANTVSLLVDQTAKPLEIIVVDDSDNDETLNIVTSSETTYAGLGVSIRHVWGKGGSARARLMGGLLSRGEIILFLDDDLAFPYDLIERMRSGFVGDVVAVWGRIFFEDLSASRITQTLSLFYYRFLFGDAHSLGGGLFAVRGLVLSDEVYFDWSLEGYSLFEDKDYACSLVKKYGMDRVVVLDRYLGVNKSRLVKDASYYRMTARGTAYFARKHGSLAKAVVCLVFLLPILAVYNALQGGGRGEKDASVRDVLTSFLGVFFDLRLIFSGRRV